MVICYDVLISADIQNHGSIICPTQNLQWWYAWRTRSRWNKR